VSDVQPGSTHDPDQMVNVQMFDGTELEGFRVAKDITIGIMHSLSEDPEKEGSYLVMTLDHWNLDEEDEQTMMVGLNPIHMDHLLAAICQHTCESHAEAQLLYTSFLQMARLMRGDSDEQ
jgi:hypothetical protein